MTVNQIIDPADSIFTSNHYKVNSGKRAVIVKSTLTSLGPQTYSGPDLYLVLVDSAGTSINASIASLDSCPGYSVGDIPSGQTMNGCTSFELGSADTIKSVQWSPRPDLTDRTLTWSR